MKKEHLGEIDITEKKYCTIPMEKSQKEDAESSRITLTIFLPS